MASKLKISYNSLLNLLNDLKNKNLIYQAKIINFYNLNYFLVRFLVDLNDISKNFPSILKHLRTFKIHWAIETSENYNLTIDFIIKDFNELQNLVSLFEIFVEKEMINFFTYFFINEIYFFNYFKNLEETISFNEISYLTLKKEKVFDLTDKEKQVLSFYSKGLNSIQIKKETGFSYYFINSILKKFKKEKIILGNKFFFSPSLLNKTPYKLLLQTTKSSKNFTKLLNFLKFDKRVINILRTSSFYDLEIYALVENYKSLLDLIKHLRSIFSFIRKTKIVLLNKDLINVSFF